MTSSLYFTAGATEIFSFSCCASLSKLMFGSASFKAASVKALACCSAGNTASDGGGAITWILFGATGISSTSSHAAFGACGAGASVSVPVSSEGGAASGGIGEVFSCTGALGVSVDGDGCEVVPDSALTVCSTDASGAPEVGGGWDFASISAAACSGAAFGGAGGAACNASTNLPLSVASSKVASTFFFKSCKFSFIVSALGV
mmetsp:Transcript_24802/g.39824  ORF Transcript_24802/g.39824 Transcript_24802/m.39824 type:complete len:203 (-) Transcript_24802:264-872(-)